MNSVCYGCPHRRLGCRNTCEAWGKEQLAKEKRYEVRDLHYRSKPDRPAVNAYIKMRDRKIQMGH